MRSTFKKNTSIGIWLALSCFGIDRVNASMPESEYLKALQIADKKVQRQKEAQFQSQALSTSTLKSHFGRFYQVGDNWDIAVWKTDRPIMRMTTEPTHLRTTVTNKAILHYEVIEISNGKIEIKITQLEDHGIKINDPKVTQIKLSLNNNLNLISKTFFLSSGSVTSSHNTIDFFPLDVPNLSDADHSDSPNLSEIPPQIQDFTKTVGFKIVPARGTFFEADDFFGRPIQVFWQKGDPWPAYIKNQNGIAILIRKGAL